MAILFANSASILAVYCLLLSKYRVQPNVIFKHTVDYRQTSFISSIHVKHFITKISAYSSQVILKIIQLPLH